MPFVYNYNNASNDRNKETSTQEFLEKAPPSILSIGNVVLFGIVFILLAMAFILPKPVKYNAVFSIICLEDTISGKNREQSCNVTARLPLAASDILQPKQKLMIELQGLPSKVYGYIPAKITKVIQNNSKEGIEVLLEIKNNSISDNNTRVIVSSIAENGKGIIINKNHSIGEQFLNNE